MLNPLSIHIDKRDLQKSIADMAKDQKMIDLPVFASLRSAVGERLTEDPNLAIQNIKFEMKTIIYFGFSISETVEAIVYFKYIA